MSNGHTILLQYYKKEFPLVISLVLHGWPEHYNVTVILPVTLLKISLLTCLLSLARY